MNKLDKALDMALTLSLWIIPLVWLIYFWLLPFNDTMLYITGAMFSLELFIACTREQLKEEDEEE